MKNKANQKKFDLWLEPIQLKQISVISMLTALLYMSMSFVDRLIAPPEALLSMIYLHMYIVPSVLWIISFLAFKKKFISFMTVLLIIAPVIAAIGNIINVSAFKNYSIYSNEIYLIIFWIFTVSGLKLKHALISSILVIIVSSINYYTLYILNTNEFILHIFWMSSSFSFGLFGKYLLEESNKVLFIKQEELSIEIQNKNVLMRELFHRVKNNLQIISGLISLQSNTIKDDSVKSFFYDTNQRIKSMAIIHEKLYASDNLESVDMQEYTNSLVEDIKDTLGGNDIDYSVLCEGINLSIEEAVPMGLIINELFTNSVKYAFDKSSTQKNVDIKMYINSEKELVLEFKDNGIGLDFDNHKNGFGFKLIQSLTEYQLEGDVKYFNKNGLNYKILFPNY